MNSKKIIVGVAMTAILVGIGIILMGKNATAVPLVFTDGGYDADMQAIYDTFYKNDIEEFAQEFPESAQKEAIIQFTRYDLNNDGVEEVFAYAHNSAIYCGTLGCNLDLYTVENNTWRKVGDWIAIYPVLPNGESAILIESTTTNGYRDISFVEGTTFKWNGEKYD